MGHTALLSTIQQFILALFKEGNTTQLWYHNLQHTQKVVAHSIEIGARYQLDEEAFFILQTAAWFHDTGHLLGYLHGHEEASVGIMFNFFANSSPTIDNSIIKQIENCILSTKAAISPRNILEQILCDADTYHFGTAAFKESDPLVKKEMESRTGQKFTDWNEKTLALLENHRFYTPYCTQLLTAGKALNIQYVKYSIAAKCK